MYNSHNLVAYKTLPEKYYYAYIRFKRKWIKIGVFSSGCKQFEKLDEIKLESTKPEYLYNNPTDEILRLAKAESNYLKFFRKNSVGNDKILSL